ncbi:alpha/beta hydrolase [Lysobacter hankyongensis]|uniref:Alpha/beta hydrolase n=1 Tax=Lysobacter hankyongensis TaxID=1176535 RepID=A0ABP9BWT9_9GAMM
MRSVLIIVAAVVVLGYAGACWFLHARQRDMIYYGGFTTVDPADTDFALKRPDATLRGWVVNPGGRAPILYFGGNAERIESNREDFARMFPGRSVYLVAYRGYGASDGAPSEAAIVDDAVALFDHVQTRHPGEPVAIIGRSLGSGVASQLAAQRPVERLALITPFDSMVGAARAHYPIFPVDWLLDERYESIRALRAFQRPVLVVHCGRDEVVPEANTLRLIAALPAAPQVLRIAAADHNDIAMHAEYAQALSGFMR